jgi:hypothetical protein
MKASADALVLVSRVEVNVEMSGVSGPKMAGE